MPYKKIVEEIWIEDMDEKSLKTLKQNIIFRLGEYRTYILSNATKISSTIFFKTVPEL